MELDTFHNGLVKEAVTVDLLRIRYNIIFNLIGSESGKRLAVMFESPCPYCTLDLGDNPIDAETQAFIAFLHFKRGLEAQDDLLEQKLPPLNPVSSLDRRTASTFLPQRIYIQCYSTKEDREWDETWRQ